MHIKPAGFQANSIAFGLLQSYNLRPSLSQYEFDVLPITFSAFTAVPLNQFGHYSDIMSFVIFGQGKLFPPDIKRNAASDQLSLAPLDILGTAQDPLMTFLS